MKKLLALIVVSAGLAAPAVAATTTTVKVVDDRFVKNSVTIKKGDTVRWVWKGRHRHNVFQVAGPGHFHSPTKTKGIFKNRFTKKGLYRFQCTYHSGQTMKVRVR